MENSGGLSEGLRGTQTTHFGELREELRGHLLSALQSAKTEEQKVENFREETTP